MRPVATLEDFQAFDDLIFSRLSLHYDLEARQRKEGKITTPVDPKVSSLEPCLIIGMKGPKGPVILNGRKSTAGTPPQDIPAMVNAELKRPGVLLVAVIGESWMSKIPGMENRPEMAMFNHFQWNDNGKAEIVSVSLNSKEVQTMVVHCIHRGIQGEPRLIRGVLDPQKVTVGGRMARTMDTRH